MAFEDEDERERRGRKRKGREERRERRLLMRHGSTVSAGCEEKTEGGESCQVASVSLPLAGGRIHRSWRSGKREGEGEAERVKGREGQREAAQGVAVEVTPSKI